MLPNMLAQIPVHSALGGKKDNEYYYMKVYWDEENYPGQYVSIPIKIKADIPEIEKVNGLVAQTEVVRYQFPGLIQHSRKLMDIYMMFTLMVN